MVDDALGHFRVGTAAGKSSALRPTTEPLQLSKTPDAIHLASSQRSRASNPHGLHHELLTQARAAGIPLSLGQSVHWLSGRGHLADTLQGVVPADLLSVLATIHHQLGGSAARLASKIGGQQPLPDLIHDELGCVIEVDEVQHFTTARARTFDLYPETVRLGYSPQQLHRTRTPLERARRPRLRSQDGLRLSEAGWSPGPTRLQRRSPRPARAVIHRPPRHPYRRAGPVYGKRAC